MTISIRFSEHRHRLTFLHPNSLLHSNPLYLNRFAEKWSNCFTATIRATNGSPNVIAITDYWGEYMNHGGWVDHVIIT